MASALGAVPVGRVALGPVPLGSVEELEHRARRRDILVDEIACIFRSSLPAVIQDAGTPV